MSSGAPERHFHLAFIGRGGAAASSGGLGPGGGSTLVTGEKVKLDIMPRIYDGGATDLRALESALREFLRTAGEILSARPVTFHTMLSNPPAGVREASSPLVALDALIARYNRIVGVVDGDLMIERHRRLTPSFDSIVDRTSDPSLWTTERIGRALERIERAKTLQACMPPLPS